MSPQKKNVIWVGRFDELASVIDKVVTSDSSTIFLVLEEGANISQNILNLRLLKREAESTGKEVIIISEDSRIRDLASRASFKVEKPEATHRRGRGLVVGDDSPHVSQPTRKVSRRLISDIIPPHSPALSDTGHSGPPTRAKSDSARAQSEDEGQLKIKRFTPASEDRILQVEHPRRRSRSWRGRRKLHFFGFANILTIAKLPYIGIRRLARILSFKPIVSMANHPYKIFIYVGLISAVAVIFFVLAQILPRVTITLTPYNFSETLIFPLVADSNITSEDFERGIIPATILEEVDERIFQYASSGSATVQEAASGKIRVFNEFSSSDQTLVASTRFISSDGHLFRTTETVVVPGATIDGGKIISSSIFVNVRAAEPGEDYNIGATTFSIPGFKGTAKYLAFYGKSESAMSGGFSGTLKVATQEDLDMARANIEEEFIPAIEERLRAKIPGHLLVLENSFSNNLEKLEFDVKAGDYAGSFSASVRARANVFLVAPEHITGAIQYYFENSSEYSQDFELSEAREIEYIIGEIDLGVGQANIEVRVQQIFNRIIDTSVLLDDVTGKDEQDVRRILSGMSELEKASVRFWPFWVKSVPSDPSDITIKVESLQK